MLLNCEEGSQDEILKKVQSLSNVKTVIPTLGSYDMVVELESETVKSLRQTITWEIRQISRIKSTITLMESLRS
jgi:DNA-binding Lrp family transcriptional regulator